MGMRTIIADMRELPVGTVTFLFTDIEGSTRLLDELGAEGYAKALAEHRRVLRQAFARNGGVEVDTQGDAFFVAFSTAPGALEAAREAQELLQLPVRMGLHTGTPLLAEEGYVGGDVHRAARIAAAGHGGQVLVSAATASLLGASQGLLLDLGVHRLKDLSAPERIYQAGDGGFPRLKTLYQTNLPVQPNALVGRERELAEVTVLLRANTLVTLTGPGGSGKTRLALQAAADLADRFVDGVWFVSLAAVTDGALIESTIAQVLGAGDELNDFLRDKNLLLLLDNLEQLLPGAAPVVAALQSRVLATSRERLNVSSEQEYPVPTLPPAEAVALFAQRARQIRPDFEPDEHVAEIAHRLDGLPLALELASSRVKVLTSEQILARLGHSLDLLTSGAADVPERQRTLRATIDWSYHLLNQQERRLFARLAVFAGSFDVEAAESVTEANLDTLSSLVDKSLLGQAVDGRFFMLETIREYALEQLARSGQADALRERHARFCVSVAEAAEAGLRTSEHFAWLARLALERDNVRAAIETLLERGDGAALRLTSSMWRFWEARGASEGRQWLRAALSVAPGSPQLRGRAHHALARLAYFQGDYDEAIELLLAAVELAGQADDIETLILSLGKLSWAYDERGAKPEANALAERILELAQQVDDPWVRAEALNDVGGLHALTDTGGVDRGAALLQESLALRRALGDEQNVADSLNNLGWAALLRGDYPEARRHLEESLYVARRLGDDFHTVLALANLGLVALFEGHYAEAIELLAENVRLCAERADRRVGAESLQALAGAFAWSGNAAIAIELAAAAAHLNESMGITLPPMIDEHIAPMLAEAEASLDPAMVSGLKRDGRVLTLTQAAELAATRPSTDTSNNEARQRGITGESSGHR
jgi:predicted ATPase/class 3 adenylate cyclase